MLLSCGVWPTQKYHPGTSRMIAAAHALTKRVSDVLPKRKRVHLAHFDKRNRKVDAVWLW